MSPLFSWLYKMGRFPSYAGNLLTQAIGASYFEPLHLFNDANTDVGAAHVTVVALPNDVDVFLQYSSHQYRMGSIIF